MLAGQDREESHDETIVAGDINVMHECSFDFSFHSHSMLDRRKSEAWHEERIDPPHFPKRCSTFVFSAVLIAVTSALVELYAALT